MVCMETLLLTGFDLTLDDVIDVARYKKKIVAISPQQCEHIAAAHRFVDELVNGKKITYGVNTGFGSLKNITISPEYVTQLQTNLIRNPSSRVRDPLSL